MSLRDRLQQLRPGPDVPPGMVPAEEITKEARRRAAAEGAGAGAAPKDADLVAQRDRLVEQFTVQQAELGGVFYEMAIRDHVRLDVLMQRAAELQRVDEELAEVERELRGEEGPAAGSCPSCGARHAAEARFCSRCGYVLQLAPANGGAA